MGTSQFSCSQTNTYPFCLTRWLLTGWYYMDSQKSNLYPPINPFMVDTNWFCKNKTPTHHSILHQFIHRISVMYMINSQLLPPPCRRGEKFFGLGIKRWVSKLLGLRGEPKFALQYFEVGGSALIQILEKIHTPETKKYHFQKHLPVVGNCLVISCIKCLLLGLEAQFLYNSHLEQADIILLGMGISAQFWWVRRFFGLRGGRGV